MKKILIVDDEPFIIKLVTRVLTTYVKEITLFTAENGEEAISILGTELIDLVITDLQMPVMDGFQLIAYIMQNFHSLPIIVLTSYDPEKFEGRLNFGVLRVIQKNNLDFKNFSEEVSRSLTTVTKGHIEGVSLFSFLQLLQIDKRTCTLTIKSSGRRGFLYFSSGEMISAICEGIESIYSAYEILTWENAKIEIDNVCRKKINIIKTSLDEVLMDAFKIKDDNEREKGLISLNTISETDSLLNESNDSNANSLENQKDIITPSNYTIAQATTEIIKTPGVILVAIVDWQKQQCLAYDKKEDPEILPTINFNSISSFFASLDNKTEVEHMLIVLHNTYHLLHPITKSPNLFFYLIVDRTMSDLAQIQIRLCMTSKGLIF